MTAHRMHCTILCLIATSGCSIAEPAGQFYERLPGDEPGSPKAAFDQWMEAVRTRDVTAYADVLIVDEQGNPINPPSEKGLEEKLQWFSGFSYLETVIASDMMIPNYERLREYHGASEVALVHLSHGHGGSAWRLMQLTFIHQQGRWRYYFSGMFGFGSWGISIRSPKSTCGSLLTAIEHRDWRSIFEMIDPDMRNGVDARKFQAEVLRRWDELAAWEKLPKPRLDPLQKVELDLPPELIPPRKPPVNRDKAKSKEERDSLDDWSRRRGDYGARLREARERTQHPPPYVAWSGIVEPDEEATLTSSNGDKVVKLFDKDSFGEVRGERFVLRSGRWYWQPKSEYTLWPYLKHETE